MPTIFAQGQQISCEPGANLRQVLLRHRVALYNGGAQVINCRAIGTCGTCAVKITSAAGATAVSPIGWKETMRLSLPPHDGTGDRRLACQVRVWEDIHVSKLDGFWGQGAQTVW
jgi:ferredoxin